MNNNTAVKCWYASVIKPYWGFCPLLPRQAHGGKFTNFIVASYIYRESAKAMRGAYIQRPTPLSSKRRHHFEICTCLGENKNLGRGSRGDWSQEWLYWQSQQQFDQPTDQLTMRGNWRSVAIMSSCDHELAVRRQKKPGNDMSRRRHCWDPLPGSD
jgi:hypothetical protein